MSLKCRQCGKELMTRYDAEMHYIVCDNGRKQLADFGIAAAEHTAKAVAGIKHDTAKPPLDLLDPLALEGLAAVLEFGRKKYAAHNWRGGFKWMRLMAALLRHAFAIIRGEDNDPESGLPHIDHLGCCWMFLSNMMKTRKDLDDRWKAPTPETGAADSASNVSNS